MIAYHCCRRLRSGSHRTNVVFDPSNQVKQSVDRQAYGSVAINAASALIIINNYETITSAADALRSATTVTGASPQRTLSRGATRSDTAYFNGWKKFFIL